MVKVLFVYGTLMQDTNSAMAHFLHARAKALGTAFLSGRLYDLGSYPGAVYDPQAEGLITGQIYSLRDPEAILAVLDDYEGVSDPTDPTEEYIRAQVPATFEGKIIYCWTYLYNQDTTSLPLIPSGNYLSYYSQQINHRRFIEEGRNGGL